MRPVLLLQHFFTDKAIVYLPGSAEFCLYETAITLPCFYFVLLFLGCDEARQD